MSNRDDLWELDVIPNYGATVRLYLVANRLCWLPGALCAHDGRRLSTPVKHIVPGTEPNTAPTFLSPLFGGGASGLSVPENSFGNTVIGRVQAIDAENDPLSYALAVSGVTTEPPLEIHAETGSIRVAVGARLNHEQRQTYSVTVTASDDLGGSTATTFDITIEDVREAPVFQSSTARRYVPEDAAAGDPVGLPVTATDADEGDTLTYSLTGADASSFEIDRDSGQITVATFDIATKDTYTVTVTADDGSTGTNATATVAVTITVGAEPVEPPPIITGGGGGGGGGGGPSPSTVDFEWTVKRDIEALDGGNDWPTGLWSDGTVLWIAENGQGADDAVYAYDLASGERLEEREFELDEANRAPRGLWSDGDTVWVSDSGRDRLFAYDLASGERQEERELELDARNADARGLWSDGETVWVLDGGKNALFAYDRANGNLLAEYALDSANSDPRGIWSDGVTVWVSDHGAKRLFAYRLPARAGPAAEDAEPQDLDRVNDEEFGELSGASNNSPRGIWANDDVMYVADESDDRVYSYNMPDAIDARLASLTLSGVDIGAFSGSTTEYEAVVGEGVTETTVEAEAMQRRTKVVIEPSDATEARRGPPGNAGGPGGDYRVRDLGGRQPHARLPRAAGGAGKRTRAEPDLDLDRVARGRRPRHRRRPGPGWHPRQGGRHLSVGRGDQRLAGLLPLARRCTRPEHPVRLRRRPHLLVRRHRAPHLDPVALNIAAAGAAGTSR